MKQETIEYIDTAANYIDAAMNNLNMVNINDLPKEAVDTFTRYRGSVGKLQVLSELMHKYLHIMENVNDI